MARLICGQKGSALFCDSGKTIVKEHGEKKKRTNADCIRSMSDDELAAFIEQVSTDSIDTISFGTKDYEEIWEHKECVLKYLQSEAKN